VPAHSRSKNGVASLADVAGVRPAGVSCLPRFNRRPGRALPPARPAAAVREAEVVVEAGAYDIVRRVRGADDRAA
jgi:hypothetical protein